MYPYWCSREDRRASGCPACWMLDERAKGEASTPCSSKNMLRYLSTCIPTRLSYKFLVALTRDRALLLTRPDSPATLERKWEQNVGGSAYSNFGRLI